MSKLHKLGNITIGCIITARVKSTRLTDKVLQDVKGRTLIEILLDHVIPADDAYEVVLAIPENSDCDILETIGTDRGVLVYRGHDDSPLHRLHEVAKTHGYDHVVRITADDPLIDQTLLRNQIKFHVNGNQDYTYMKRCPEGVAGEVIRTSILKKVVEKIGDKPVEFISYYLKNKGYNVKEYFPPLEYQAPYRLTIDYPEDLTLLRLIFAVLPDGFGTLDFINYLKQHKYFLQINHLPTVTIYSCNYNTSEYIKAAIQSVADQTFTDWEYIILDDCSTDNSLNTIAEYFTSLPSEIQAKIKILRQAQNTGLPTACNYVLTIARGKYIIRLDSDDILYPTAIEKMVDAIRAEDSQGVITGYSRIDEAGEVTETVNKNSWHPGCSMLSKWTVNELKYKDGLQYLEGEEFFKRFREQYTMSFIPESLWGYRRRPGQKTQDPNHPHNNTER